MKVMLPQPSFSEKSANFTSSMKSAVEVGVDEDVDCELALFFAPDDAALAADDACDDEPPPQAVRASAALTAIGAMNRFIRVTTF